MAAAVIRAEPIAGARLLLEPLRVEHAREMAAVLDDPALHAFIGGSPSSAPELSARYARMLAGPEDSEVSWCNWVIRSHTDEDRATAAPGGPAVGAVPGVLVGTVQTTVTPGRDADDGPVAELAWVVGTSWQGRGIATRAARALAGWLEGQGVRTLIAHIHPDHRASAAVALAVGLVPTAHLHDGEVVWRRPPTGAR